MSEFVSADRLAFRVFTLAKATGLSESYIKRAIYEGKLRAYKQGSATLILTSDALAWITERQATREPAQTSEAVN